MNKWIVEKTVGKRSQRKIKYVVENNEKLTECTRRAVMLDWGISKFVDVLHAGAQGCTLSTNLFQLYTIYTRYILV